MPQTEEQIQKQATDCYYEISHLTEPDAIQEIASALRTAYNAGVEDFEAKTLELVIDKTVYASRKHVESITKQLKLPTQQTQTPLTEDKK
jgi:epoxyqueuosine reductase QueG